MTYDYEGATNRFYGRTTGIEDAAGTTTTMSYDRFGRITEKKLVEKDSVEKTVGLRYTYTKGILSQVRRQDANGNTQTYGYDHDSFGNLREITVGDIALAEYVYGPQNGYLLEQTYGNGDGVAYEYDNLGRTTAATYSSGRTLRYTYTGDGQVHSIVDDNGTTDVADDLTYAYTYDTLGRTVDSQMCRGIQVLLKTHWEYDDANRI